MDPLDLPGTAEILPLTDELPRPTNMRRTVPIGSAVASMRARHHVAVRAVAAWSLHRGRPCDLDVVALCIDTLGRYQSPSSFPLDRPSVNGVLWGEISNMATMLDTSLPDDWHRQLWSVINWLHEDGRLSPQSDPLVALLEPLRCYGGLGDDGDPMPPGCDVPFPCQCHVPFDPTCPADLAQRVVGRDPKTRQRYIVRARIRPRSEEATLSDYQPLFALARRVREKGGHLEVHADEFAYVGQVDASRSTPLLRLFTHTPTCRLGFDDLVLDDAGNTWAATPDRRRTTGFRWAQVADHTGLIRAGVTWR